MQSFYFRSNEIVFTRKECGMLNGGKPHAIGDVAVSMETHHFVFLRDVMQEGVLIIGKKSVWNPDLFGKVTRQGHDVRGVS